MKRRDLERHLKDHGCELERQGAKHEWWVSPQGRSSIPRHNQIVPNTVRKICRELNVPAPPNVK